MGIWCGHMSCSVMREVGCKVGACLGCHVWAREAMEWVCGGVSADVGMCMCYVCKY